MREFKEYKVFIASPGDVEQEREIVRSVCDQFNQDILVRSHGIAFNAFGWEDAIPDAGRPQEIINGLVEDCDIFVCLFHKRLGTPSGKAESGTLEEFLLAYESWRDLKKPHILFYFKDVQISSARDLADPQLLKVLELKEKIESDRLLLFGTFAGPEDFRMKFTGHIKRWIKQNTKPKDTAERPEKFTPLQISETYRNWLIDHCQYMDIDKLREKSDVIQVQMPEIFVPLYANDPEKSKDKIPDSEESRLMERNEPSDIEALAQQYDYLLVEGVAGSGKSTLIKHVAHRMIQDPGPSELDDSMLPVLILLKDLKGFDPASGSAEKGHSLADEMMAYYFKKTDNGLNLDTVRAFCEAGKTLFLIDGLDEIDAALREAVAKAFGSLKARANKVRIMLTGRPHGIDDAVLRHFGKHLVKILPFTMDQVETFITKWFWSYYSSESRIGEKTTQGMISDIKTHPGIEKLIDNPLMLTAICILYHDERELPGQRAELYKKFISNLLFRRFRGEDERVHAYLKQLAFDMFTAGDRGIDRLAAIKLMRNEYPIQDDETEGGYRRRLDSKFGEIEPNCGLLTFQDGQYNFRHLTLQEFLAATAIMDRELDYTKAIKDYWGNERYKEVIELFIGYLSIENKSWANKIVENALREADQVPYSRYRLAARALLDMHRDRRKIEVTDLATEKLRAIIASDTPPKERADAGELLGWLGDRRDLDKFVPIDSGEYETSAGKIKIDKLEISSYAVTNLWFKKFIKDEGYSNASFWSEEGKKWIKHIESRQPRYWYERRYNCPNMPVTGVCWYEADAFARWMTLSRGDGYIYRLPDEREWEAAAAGFKKRKYPWGNEWADDHCNTRESGVETLSPVGIFAKGSTPEGVSDLAGNVWEWTCSDYHSRQIFYDFRFDVEIQKMLNEENYDDYLSKIEEKDRQLPVLRGGSWINDQDNARCANRYGDYPNYRDYSMGFRCVRIKN
jgi:formylglycine-generating enzyme required for sulfatase activity